jgi:peptidoglycan/xylan/chitin deacetylase (PgdA/CDA1 family)
MIILLYHNIVLHRPSAFNMLARPDWLPVDKFEEEIASLAERFDLVSLDQIADAIREGRPVPRGCAITFDDGYSGAYKYGLPVLEKYGATGAYFVITQHVGDSGAPAHDYVYRLEALVYLTRAESIDLAEFGFGVVPLTCDACKLAFFKDVRRWIKDVPPSQQERLKERLREQLDVSEEQITAYLSHEAYRPVGWSDVADMRRRGCVVGSHTRTHRPLSQLAPADVEQEIVGSYDDLRERFGDGELSLAYPFGQAQDYNNDVVAAARKAGYGYALTAISGLNDEATDPFELRRVTFRDLKKLRQAF